MINGTLQPVDAMPDGRGGWQPIPPVLTEAEVVRLLRLDTKAYNPDNTLRHLRDTGRLKLLNIGKGKNGEGHTYSRGEVLKLIQSS